MRVAPGTAVWAQTSDKEFKLTFYAVLLKGGEVNGYLRVHSTMVSSDSGNEFTSRECQRRFPCSLEEKLQAMEALWEDLSPGTRFVAQAGKTDNLSVPIKAVFPLENIQEAHRDMHRWI
jgi:hypothetical protein